MLDPNKRYMNMIEYVFLRLHGTIVDAAGYMMVVL